MKFEISLASNGYNKPCDEAIQLGEDDFEIEINSLEDLIKLIDEHGRIVIYELNPFICKNRRRLLIYDDYIE